VDQLFLAERRCRNRYFHPSLYFFEWINLIILAGVGSTFFTIFALPKNRTANARNIIGSYLICITVGLFCIYLKPPSLSGGVAIGVSTFLMVITDTEHPPAAGVALCLSKTQIIDDAYAGAILAVFIKRILSPWLKDLI
jgi:CBS-domain-containing membrane protein